MPDACQDDSVAGNVSRIKQPRPAGAQTQPARESRSSQNSRDLAKDIATRARRQARVRYCTWIKSRNVLMLHAHRRTPPTAGDAGCLICLPFQQPRGSVSAVGNLYSQICLRYTEGYIELDPTDERLALLQLEAHLGAVVRRAHASSKWCNPSPVQAMRWLLRACSVLSISYLARRPNRPAESSSRSRIPDRA